MKSEVGFAKGNPSENNKQGNYNTEGRQVQDNAWK
jgi:hypothetical protein